MLLLMGSLTALASPTDGADEPLYSEVIVKIREEGLRRSQVMDLASVMTDVYGPRFANSPSYDAATLWAKERFEAWGLQGVELETWGEYGYGWENTYTSIHMVAPRYQPVIGYAKPGTRGTDGQVRANVVAVDLGTLSTTNDLEALRGTLTGKIVLTTPARTLVPNFSAQAIRLSDEELGGMARLEIDRLQEVANESDSQDDQESASRESVPRDEIEAFLDSEGVAALVEPGTSNVGPMDKGVVHVSGGRPLAIGDAPAMPAVIIAAEHYNRMMRILDQGIEVEMEIEVRNTLHADDPMDRNVLGEIRGGDLANEVVMIGGHFDAEPAATGATDNAAGSAIVMEAMRILQAIGAKPRRTIRAALWGAEESGLLGSRGYVRQHLADPESGERTAAHDDFSVYFNVDWYGRFRGIYLQGNDATQPIFEAWMRPFADIGMSWIVPGNTGGTDHMAFLEAGLPGFQFIQDDLEFFNVTFHTNMDVYDRLISSDLKQAAVILASFAYHAAMRDEKFPRADGLDNGRRWHK